MSRPRGVGEYTVQKGAATWAAGKRQALANDPNLLAVDAATNRSKGDGDNTATWLPPNKSFACTYVAH